MFRRTGQGVAHVFRRILHGSKYTHQNNDLTTLTALGFVTRKRPTSTQVPACRIRHNLFRLGSARANRGLAGLADIFSVWTRVFRIPRTRCAHKRFARTDENYLVSWLVRTYPYYGQLFVTLGDVVTRAAAAAASLLVPRRPRRSGRACHKTCVQRLASSLGVRAAPCTATASRSSEQLKQRVVLL